MCSSPANDRRALVGLSTYRETATWGVWNLMADLLPRAYSAAVVAVGGVPVLVPPLADKFVADRVVDSLDALIITGGADINPARYSVARDSRTVDIRNERDESELLLLDSALRSRIPVLGICRGMQLMAVAAGGALAQHHPEVVGNMAHSPGGASFGSTIITPVPESMLSHILGGSRRVLCHHHQAVIEHPMYLPSAYAEDGTVEAIERSDRGWLGVQWHPEMGGSPEVFSWLVEAAMQSGMSGTVESEAGHVLSQEV